MGFISRIGKEFKEKEMFKIFFRSLVRSILKFAWIVWSPTTQWNCEMNEKNENKCLRLLYLKYFWHLNHPTWQVRYKNAMYIWFCTITEDMKISSIVLLAWVDDPVPLSKVSWCVPAYDRRASNLMFPGRPTVAHSNYVL